MRAFWLAMVAVVTVACVDGTASSGSTPEATTSAASNRSPGHLLEVSRDLLGGPIPGLTADEFAAFVRGKAVFERRFKPSEGLGPLYNATACASCHSTPVTGGSAQLYRNFYIATVATGMTQTAFPALPSVVVPAYGVPPHLSATFDLSGGRFVIPDTYFGLDVVVGQRNSVPIFGVGLFEFISDATIMSNADPDDTSPADGISGRFNTDVVGIGRLGVKAQANNIELFTRPPLMNQMGITSDPFQGDDATVSLSSLAVQATVDPNDPTSDSDGVPDPEISRDELGDLIAFTRFLAPPAKKPLGREAERGQQFFEAIGCTKCHIPFLPSSRGPVNAYTDLLLHDLGTALADNLQFGTPQASLISPDDTGQEFRTQPLWGVSLHAPFLHDGRAATLQEAILAHGGEAEFIKIQYDGLKLDEKQAILTFLKHL